MKKLFLLSLLILPIIAGNAQGKVKGIKNLSTPEPSRLVIKSSLHRIQLKPCGSVASPEPSPTPSIEIRTNEVN